MATRGSIQRCAALAVLTWAVLAAPGRAETTLYAMRSPLLGDGFGSSAASAGDVNADGVPDWIIGAPLDSRRAFHAGSARVFSGSDGRLLFTLYGEVANDEFGCAVSGAGDVNGDGFDDLLVGSRYADVAGANSGSAQVFSGRTQERLQRFDGESDYDLFGSSVAAVGDVNGDGFGDFAVAAPRADARGADSGRVWIYSGRDASVLHRFAGFHSGDSLGHALAAAGDVDGDGLPDLIVGSPGADPHGSASGSALVLSGADGSVLHVFSGDSAYDNLGVSVAGAGDVDGDGHADLIVGASRDDTSGSDAGSAFVYSGADGRILYTLPGANVGDFFGCSVSGGGDLDGDGVPDLIVAACRSDGAGSNSGSVRAFSGASGRELARTSGFDALDRFGTALAPLGDLDGDGRAEFLATAPARSGRGTRVGSARVLSVAPKARGLAP